MTTYYDSRIDWEFIRGKEGDWSVGYVPNIKDRRGLVRSGTTILFGFDLGQHDLPELKSLHLSTALETKLQPYLQKRGADAVMAPQRRLEGALDTLIAINNAQTGASTGSVGRMASVGVNNRPNAPVLPGQAPRQFVAPQTTVLRLELSTAERAELTAAIQRHFYERLRTHYDAHRGKRKFSELPAGVQTALLSLSWQTGSIWAHKHGAYPIFHAALKEDWAGAVRLLKEGSFVHHASKADALRRRSEAKLLSAAAGLDAPGPAAAHAPPAAVRGPLRP